MLLDIRIRLVAKSYGEAGHKTLKRSVNLEGFGAVSVMFQNFLQDIWALFLKARIFGRFPETPRKPLFICLSGVSWFICSLLCGQCSSMLRCLLWRCCLGFSSERSDVKFFPFPSTIEACPWGCCSASWSFLSNLGSSSHFVPLLGNNACQLTSFSSQGPHMVTSPVLQLGLQLLVEIVCTHGGLVSFSDHRWV